MKSAEDADKDERLMHLEAQLMVMKTIDVHKEAERSRASANCDIAYQTVQHPMYRFVCFRVRN